MTNDFNLKKFLTENKLTRNSKLLNEAYDNEPTDEDYIATKNKVKNHLELIEKEIEEYENRFARNQGIDPDEYYEDPNNRFPSKLLFDTAYEVVELLSNIK